MQRTTEKRLTVSVPEAARLLGISRNLAYDLVRTGELPSLRLGAKRLVISRAALERFLEKSAGRKVSA
jgi:excisionase family DNA binding protein